jgi:hypothetical protein
MTACLRLEQILPDLKARIINVRTARRYLEPRITSNDWWLDQELLCRRCMVPLHIKKGSAFCGTTCICVFTKTATLKIFFAKSK